MPCQGVHNSPSLSAYFEGEHNNALLNPLNIGWAILVVVLALLCINFGIIDNKTKHPFLA
jgi:hypothetical protein